LLYVLDSDENVAALHIDDLAAPIAPGTNLIGKVGIDQSTPNANEVVIKSGTVTMLTNALPVGSNAIGKIITPSFSASDSLQRPANTTPYAVNKSINCSVAVTAMSYTLKVVTLTAANTFAVGDRITVAGVNTGFTATNIDGNWTCKSGTNATTVVFDVTNQPTGTTPQTVSAGTIAKCFSFDVAGVVGGGVIISSISVTLPGAVMTGAVRCYVYTVQPSVLVDQATFTLLSANDIYRKDYFDLYPVTEGSGSDVTFASVRLWEIFKCEAADTRLYIRLAAEGAGTPASAGVVTLRITGVQLLG
jgi:hypothetical protein